MNRLDSRRSPSALALLVLVVTFVAGALVGVAFDRSFFAPDPSRFLSGPRGDIGYPPGRIFAIDGRISQQLDLTEGQRDRIDSIMQAERFKSTAVLSSIRPPLQARYDSTANAILTVLTPAQRDEFERLRLERRDQIERRLGPGFGRRMRRDFR